MTHRWLGRLLAQRGPTSNPSRLIYGVIAIGALLAAESGLHASYLDTIASAVIAIGLFWLAHAYSNVLGRRLLTHERLAATALWAALVEEWPLVQGAGIPLGALVVVWAAGATQATAVSVALWTAVASVIGFELIAGIRSRATPRELALDMSVGATMGLAIVALKVVLH